MNKYIKYKGLKYRVVDKYSYIDEICSNLLKAEDYIKKSGRLKQKVCEELPGLSPSDEAFKKLGQSWADIVSALDRFYQFKQQLKSSK